jgi:hypothetical protein
VGIEPTTFGLKGRCSTTELRPYGVNFKLYHACEWGPGMSDVKNPALARLRQCFNGRSLGTSGILFLEQLSGKQANRRR